MIIDEKLLDEVSAKAKVSGRLRMNYNFHESLEAKSQRMLNALEPGTVLPIHRHTHTDETYVVLRGKLMVRFYNEAGEVTEVFPLDPASGRYGVNIPKGQWHGLTVEESAVIFECKDGPYCPVRAEDVLRVND